MQRPLQPISFANPQLGDVRHICAFFMNDDEEYRVLLLFIREGLSRGEKAVHVVNPGEDEDHLRRLTAEGVNTTVHQQSAQLRIQNTTEVCLRDGRFDQERMLAAFGQMAGDGRTAEGLPRSRIVCRMDWATEDRSRIENVIEFESRVNDVWCRYDDAVICTYHLPKFSGDAVIDIMRTHPMVIIGGHLQQNPFFVPPKEFLREYRGRRFDRG
jgi:hypothetical protein